MNCEKAEPAKPRLPTRHPNDNDEEQVATVPMAPVRDRGSHGSTITRLARVTIGERLISFRWGGREGASESGANLLTQSMGGDNEVTEKSHIVNWTNAKQIIFYH